MNNLDFQLESFTGIQNLNNVIWQYELFKAQRKKLLINQRKIKLSFPLCIECIIAKPNIDACLFIWKFLEECNLKT